MCVMSKKINVSLKFHNVDQERQSPRSFERNIVRLHDSKYSDAVDLYQSLRNSTKNNVLGPLNLGTDLSDT